MARIIAATFWLAGAGPMFVGAKLFALADERDWPVLGAVGFVLLLVGAVLMFLAAAIVGEA